VEPTTADLLDYFEQIPAVEPTTAELLDYFEQLPAAQPTAAVLLDYFEQLAAAEPTAADLLDFFEQLPTANLLSTNARSSLVYPLAKNTSQVILVGEFGYFPRHPPSAP
jgi:hypothetical protein